MNERIPQTPPDSSKTVIPRLLRASSLLLTLVFSGCFQIDELVRLKPDGSGTLEQTVTMSQAGIAQFSQIPGGISVPGLGSPSVGAGGAAQAFKLLDEAKLKEEAGKMGEGVTFVSAREVKTATGEGYTAIFAFPDVNKLKISADPANIAGGSRRRSRSPESGNEQKGIKLAFTQGQPAELQITLPQTAAAPRAKSIPSGADGAFGDPMTGMLMQALKDMHVSVSIQPEGTIVSTNSQYRSGPKITLLDVDFNKLLADPAKLNELIRMNGQNPPDGISILKGVPGAQFETANPLFIRFQ